MDNQNDFLEELILDLAFEVFRKSAFGSYRVYHRLMRANIMADNIVAAFNDIKIISDELVDIYGYSQNRADIEVIRFFKKIELK